jgi:hypothetical protein
MGIYDPWWKGKDLAKLGEGIPDCSWAAQALTQDSMDAVAHGFSTPPVLFDNSLEGVMRAESEDAVVKWFTDRGLSVISRSPPWRGDTFHRYFLVRTDAAVACWFNDGDLECRVVTTDAQLFADAQKFIEQAIGPKASAGRAYVLMSTDEGPKLQSIGVASVPLERGNYNPDVLEDFDHIVADLKAKEPTGRLAIFDGVPGTGKTYMIRGLLASVPQALFVIVPAGLIQELANPGMINALLETRRNKGDLPTVFLIEDADDCLGSRDQSNVNAVSALLNLGDGILGALMDLRLVCTTNLKNDELDEAVVRPGRLSRKVHVGPLYPKVAEDLYERLTGKRIRIDEELTLAEVYSKARDQGWRPVENKRTPVGFAVDRTLSPSALVDTHINYGVDLAEDETFGGDIFEEE